nr:MAG TPA: Solute carrier family 3 member 2 N-terminus [Caudoviricetes sp.]
MALGAVAEWRLATSSLNGAPAKPACFVGRRDARKQSEECLKRRSERSGLCGEEVMRMGDGRWAKALRFLTCLLIILVVMVYISPKAC